jgi:predicted transcriptional regulator
MVGNPLISDFSRRERQIMDIIYRLGTATAAEVAESLPDSPGNSAVRKLLSILEDKGFLRHERGDKNRYVYSPTIPPDEASRSALDHMLQTFFEGSAARAAIAMLKQSESDVSDDDREAILRLIDSAKKHGR